MAYTPYVPTDWEELPTQTTPIDETALDKIEQGIVELEDNTIFYEELGTINESTGVVTLNSNS